MAPPVERGVDLVDLACRQCGLCEGRTQVVPAEGGRSRPVFFVGEAPGPDEDRQGRPFVGRAGKILRASLKAAGWDASRVWITNVVKCFPHERSNGRAKIRAPRNEEAEACRPNLLSEIGALDPPLLVALGRTAAMELLGRRDLRLEEVRGRVSAARAELGGRPVFVTYHPSGLHYGKGRREVFEADLLSARVHAGATA